MPAPFAVENAKWEVMWVAVKKKEKRIVAIDFDDDFVSALQLYEKARKGKKPLATLRCRNVGFPLPEKHQGRILALNKEGVWWCPFCMQLRRFEKRGWAECDGEIFPSDPAYYCPMCDISHHNGHVIRFNPIAQMLKIRQAKGGRRSRGKRRRRG